MTDTQTDKGPPILYRRYNKQSCSAKGMCVLHVKKILILVFPSIAISHSPKYWGEVHESGLYGS